MAEGWAPKKPNFGPPPPGYVAGLGRGATGFITRSDIGPARIPEVKNIVANQIDEGNYNQNKYDDWEGYKGALFSKNALDDEDRQAEQAYDYCEKRVYARREKERTQIQNKLKLQHKEQNSINSKFVDLKRQLAKISTQQWESIPECIDQSIKKRKRQKYTPVPDAIVMNLLAANENKTTFQVEETNNQDFRQAKEVLLKSKLDNAQNTVTGKSNVDKIGYMTQLNSSRLEPQMIGDIKKARTLLKSAMSSNPKNPDIWLSAARVEQIDGKINQCREILRKAIQSCPLSEQIWIELSRIQKPEQSGNVLLEGLRSLPSSQKLWLYAARKQSGNPQLKSKILRKGLENVSNSVRLWRQLIEMQPIEQAKKLLYKAVQSLPKQIDLWLALSKIQDYKNAQKVLNKARKCNPLNLSIWISAAKLQQTQNKVQPIVSISQKIENILTKGRQILKKNGANISRQQWLDEAFYAQKSQNLITCEMLVKISLSYGLSKQQLNNVLLKDVQFYQKQRQSNHVTRYLYHYGVITTKNKQLLWSMIEFENRKKVKKQYDEITKTLTLATNVFQDDGQIWKTIIDKLINDKNYDSALEMIDVANKKVSQNTQEPLCLLKVQIFKQLGQIQKCRSELQHLINQFPKGQSALQLVLLEYEEQNYKDAWIYCQKYFHDHKSEKIWKLAFRIKQKIGTYAECTTIIEKALQIYPRSKQLWKEYIYYQIEEKHISKARALISRASLKILQSEELALISVELQKQLGNKKEAQYALAQALKQFSKNPQIWALAIELQNPAIRKKKANSAIEACGQNTYINCSVAKVFWKQLKNDKAKKWFEQALKMNPNNADVWAYYVAFIIEAYPLEQSIVEQRFKGTQGSLEGRKWNKLRQKINNPRASSIQLLNILVDEVKTEMQKFQ